eukprot:GILI01011195.1.p1 GENE.GILI01011195.1~~GILI01011195.1.p1  ORF type:complete len:515 (-),score=148.05 GILI01011195.1:117-1661(-)
MSFVCSISGSVCEEPVASKSSGHIYEKRLVEKHIQATGQCPITQQPLSVDDLVRLQVSKNVKPRPVAATSIPGMLQLFQNEWDSLMLETFNLKQQLDTNRQELSHALYQHDAACRVIARLVKERDAARSELARLQGKAGGAPAAVPSQEGMDVEKNSSGPDAAIAEKIESTASQLSSQRKKRPMPADLASSEDIAAMAEVSSNPVHKASKPGITCVDVNVVDAANGLGGAAENNGDNLILSGGNDGDVVLFNRGTGKVLHKMEGHGKRVTDVLFHNARLDTCFSASADSTVRVWRADSPADSVSFSCAATFKEHKDEVTGVAIHPSGDLLLTASLDGSWAFLDLTSADLRVAAKVTDASNGGFSCVNMHPDGRFMATGTVDSKVRMWDLRSAEDVATFEGHRGALRSLSFSENGYHLATVGEDAAVRLWDLRKLSNFHTIQLEEGASPSQVNFDLSAKYLAVGGAQDIKVFETKKWSLLTTLAAASVTDVKFGKSAKFLASTSLDRSLKIFSRS